MLETKVSYPTLIMRSIAIREEHMSLIYEVNLEVKDKIALQFFRLADSTHPKMLQFDGFGSMVQPSKP